MSRRYQEPVIVTLRPDSTPATRRSPGVARRIACGRCWRGGTSKVSGWLKARRGNRYYCRVVTPDYMVFDLFMGPTAPSRQLTWLIRVFAGPDSARAWATELSHGTFAWDGASS